MQGDFFKNSGSVSDDEAREIPSALLPIRRS